MYGKLYRRNVSSFPPPVVNRVLTVYNSSIIQTLVSLWGFSGVGGFRCGIGTNTAVFVISIHSFFAGLGRSSRHKDLDDRGVRSFCVSPGPQKERISESLKQIYLTLNQSGYQHEFKKNLERNWSKITPAFICLFEIYKGVLSSKGKCL